MSESHHKDQRGAEAREAHKDQNLRKQSLLESHEFSHYLQDPESECLPEFCALGFFAWFTLALALVTVLPAGDFKLYGLCKGKAVYRNKMSENNGNCRIAINTSTERTFSLAVIGRFAWKSSR